MHLTDASIGATHVLLSGARAAIEIRCPGPGVLRVRHAPSSAATSFTHPDLPPKRSFAVVAEGALPLSARREGDALHVSAEGASLEVSLASGTWIFGDGQGRTLARSEGVSGEVRGRIAKGTHAAMRRIRPEHYRVDRPPRRRRRRVE